MFNLIEEFRAPFADRQVVALFGRGFKPEIGKDGLLRKKTRETLTRGVSEKMVQKNKMAVSFCESGPDTGTAGTQSGRSVWRG